MASTHVSELDEGDLIRHYNSAYYKPGYGGRTKNSREFDRLGAYWRYSLFEAMGIPVEAHTLDFGAGLGLITSKLLNCVCYDFSEYARSELRKAGRRVVDDLDKLNKETFDVILISHVLEHVLNPAETLKRLAPFLKDNGFMFVILPVERETTTTFSGVDANNHLYCWTAQTIGNLVTACHLTIDSQTFLYGPFGLRLLCEKFRLKQDLAVRLSHLLGQYKRNRMSQSILTVVTKPNLRGNDREVIGRFR